jgi:predicted TIM-barrel fold metal-dependent hydrolase
VSHCGLAIKKGSLKHNKNYGNSNISPCKNIIFKKSSKRNQNPSRDYNSISSLSTQAKISSFKNPYIKIDLLLPRGL